MICFPFYFPSVLIFGSTTREKKKRVFFLQTKDFFWEGRGVQEKVALELVSNVLF